MTDPDAAHLEARVRTLWEIEQIKQLKARYFRYVDTRDWVALRELFTDDCSFESPGMAGVRGPDEFVQRVEELLTPGVSVHHGHMPEIEVVDDASARGTWSMYDYLEVGDGPTVTTSHGYGHYIETYRKDGRQVWRISSWRLVRIRVDMH